jgi:hypothetical protein
MSTPSSNDEGRARRVIVTLLVTTAAAAVTAGVALQQHPHAEAVVQAAEASPALAGGIAATAAPVVTRREQWRDPWKRPGALSESAPTSIHETTDTVITPSDPSLPAATPTY